MKPFIIHIDKHNNFNKIFIPLAIKFSEILKKIMLQWLKMIATRKMQEK